MNQIRMREEQDRLGIRERRGSLDGAIAVTPRLLSAADYVPCLIWQTNSDGATVYFNAAWSEFTGRSRAELVADGLRAAVHPEDRAACEEAFRRAVSRREDFRVEYRLLRHDGEYRWFLDQGRPIREEGEFAGLAGCAVDIHDKVQSETELRDAARNKETLLRELHHRVKNNMQVISSMLNLQLPLLWNERDRELVEEMKGRIRAMALVHDRLLRGDSLDRVEMKSYASALVSSLCAIHNSSFHDSEVDVRGDEFACSLDCAIPMGLIINELVSNSFKYASAVADRDPLGPPLRVEVYFRRRDESLVLTVEDNGVGFPAGFQFEDSSGVGLRLVSILSRQLRGRVEIDPERRSRIRVRFPDL